MLKKKRRRSLKRGQAMVEYSLIAHMLLLGGAVVAWSYFTVFMNAMDTYYQQIFDVLTAPMP